MNSVLNLIEREANNEPINIDDFTFKCLLLEMLGPVLQTSLVWLRSNYLGQFYSGVRIALVLPGSLIDLLKGKKNDFSQLCSKASKF